MRSILPATTLLLVAIVTVAGTALGQRSSSPLLLHRAWTVRDGAPSDVLALVQTRDGYLWLGTSTGLFRFDGVEFERFAPRGGESLRSPNIRSLLAMDDGGLYIGYAFGGVSVLERGHLRSYGEAEGLPGSSVHSLVRDSTGVVWAATGVGLYRQRRDRWEHVDIAAGSPTFDVRHALVDRGGTLWVGVPNVGVFSLARGGQRFVRQQAQGGEPGDDWTVVETTDGAVWAAHVDRNVIRIRSASGVGPSAEMRGSADHTGYMFADRDSNLWTSNLNGIARTAITHDSAGRRHIRPLEQVMPDGGMSGKLIVSMITDREGNVWIGTEGGLDQFRHPKLDQLPLLTGFLSPAIAVGERGNLWVGNTVGPMLRFDQSGAHLQPTVRSAQASFRETSGQLWFGTEDGELWHSTGDGFARDAMPRDADRQPVQSVARDDAGHLWVSVVHKGVYCRIGTEWTAFCALEALPKVPALRLVTDSSGALWFGYTGNRVARLAGGAVRLYGASDGIAIGNVMTITVANGHVWIGGEAGLMRLEGDRFASVVGFDGLPFRGVTGIVENRSGELWLNGADGVTRVDAAELRTVGSPALRRVRFERFDTRDGLDGTAPQLRPLPTVVASDEGTLWLTTTQSVFRIDPAHIRRNAVPPPVTIRALIAGGVRYDAGDTTTLPASTRAVQIRYTALSLGIPDRVHFRYQLVGSDEEWQDAGTRRDAFYTNLKPGTYEFRVIAANDDGVWNDAGAAMTIAIPPTFVQTPFFLFACMAAVASLGVLAYRMRLRTVSTALRERYDIRLAERTRIAQDLHDTLLQGFTGITLQLQGVHRAIAASDAETGERLDRILLDADATLREARHAVWEMRAPELDRLDLVGALSTAARASMLGTPLDLHVSVAGEQRRLPSDIEVAALRIGREAVMNALLHANASIIEIMVLFDARLLQICVRDDGIGVPASAAETAERRGHWGLSGMRARAARVGGTLEIGPARNGGTEVVVSIPIDAASATQAPPA